MDEFSICLPAHADDVWVNALYVYMHIQRVEGLMLNMYTFTFRGLMDECLICIYALSEG